MFDFPVVRFWDLLKEHIVAPFFVFQVKLSFFHFLLLDPNFMIFCLIHVNRFNSFSLSVSLSLSRPVVALLFSLL